MEAVVTIKATPEEFRLIREALESQREIAMAIADDKSHSGEERVTARRTAARIGALLEKI